MKGYGYYAMANGDMKGLIQGLSEMKEQAGNKYVSFSYKYDPYPNKVEIQVISQDWMDKIIKLIEECEGDYWGWDAHKDDINDDIVKITPMKFY